MSHCNYVVIQRIGLKSKAFTLHFLGSLPTTQDSRADILTQILNSTAQRRIWGSVEEAASWLERAQLQSLLPPPTLSGLLLQPGDPLFQTRLRLHLGEVLIQGCFQRQENRGATGFSQGGLPQHHASSRAS